MVTLDAYAVEWAQALVALLAVLTHIVAVWDTTITVRVVSTTHPYRLDLLGLAHLSHELALWRLIQQIIILGIGVASVTLPPPPLPLGFENHMSQIYSVRVGLILVSILSIVKELRSLFGRRKIIAVSLTGVRIEQDA